MSKEWTHAYTCVVRDNEFLRQNEMVFGDPTDRFLVGNWAFLDDIAVPGSREAKLSRDDPRPGILIGHFDPREDILLVALHGEKAIAKHGNGNAMVAFSYVLTGYDISAGKGTLVEPAIIEDEKISVLRELDCSFAFVLGVSPEDIAPAITRVLINGMDADEVTSVSSRNIVLPNSTYTH